MTEKQEKKVAVQKAVMEVMEKNISKWRAVSAMKKKYDLFVRNIKKIDDYMSAGNTDIAPLKENRLHAKKAMIEQVFPVISVLGVYAYDTGDRKLGKSVHMKFGELEKMNADELKKYSIRILKTARSLMDQKRSGHVITDYGLTGKHLDQLQKSLDQFIRDDETFVHTRKEKKKSRKKLDRRIRENDQLLKKQLDKMMHLFRNTQKTFYSAYIRSRTVPPEKPEEQQEPQDEALSKATGPVTNEKKEPAGKREGGTPAGKTVEDRNSADRETAV